MHVSTWADGILWAFSFSLPFMLVNGKWWIYERYNKINVKKTQQHLIQDGCPSQSKIYFLCVCQIMLPIFADHSRQFAIVADFSSLLPIHFSDRYGSWQFLQFYQGKYSADSVSVKVLGGWRSQDCHGYHCCSIRFCTFVPTSLFSTSPQARQLLMSLNKIVYFFIFSNNQGFLNNLILVTSTLLFALKT